MKDCSCACPTLWVDGSDNNWFIMGSWGCIVIWCLMASHTNSLARQVQFLKWRTVICRRGHGFVVKLKKAVLWVFYQSWPFSGIQHRKRRLSSRTLRPRGTKSATFRYHRIPLDHKVPLRSLLFLHCIPGTLLSPFHQIYATTESELL